MPAESLLGSCRPICSGISQRWVFTIMAFVAMTIGHSIRVILSIAITEMVLPLEKEIARKDDTCSDLEKPLTSNVTVGHGTYAWDEYTQGLILSSYFWGYAATQFPFGFLSERFGGKYLYGFGILIPSILSTLTPLAVAWGDSTALIVIRILMGISSGPMFPTASTLVSRWTTPAQRTMCCTIVFTGAVSGAMLGTVGPAIIIRYTNMGWQGVFYCFGAAGIIWFPFWALLCYDSPETHPFISEKELNHFNEHSQRSKNKKQPPAPLGRIITSKSAWAFFIALFGVDWIYYTIASDLPKYMSDIVKLSIEDNGLLSSLPHLAEWILSIVSTWIANWIIANKWMSIKNERKLFNTVCIMGSACFIVAASYAECNQVLVVILFILSMGMLGFSYPSMAINALDLSPHYSGTLYAIGNGLAALGGIFSPYIIGYVTPNQTIGEWRLVFWIVFGIAVLSSLYFLLFASAEVQDWDDPCAESGAQKKLKTTPEQGAEIKVFGSRSVVYVG